MKRNPNGYGSITKLKGNRVKPWMIRVSEPDESGNKRQRVIGYADTRKNAMIILGEYNKEPWNPNRDKFTLKELYDQWYELKAMKMGENSRLACKSAFRHLKKYYDAPYRTIRAIHMQDTIDRCGKGYSTQSSIKTLWYHLDNYAYEMDVISKMYSPLVTCEKTPESTRTIFTRKEIDLLWKNVGYKQVNTVLIFLYTGFRANELLSMKLEDVDTQEWILKGGSKTAAGKCRTVPIHDRIKPLVSEMVKSNKNYLFEIHGSKIPYWKYNELWWDMMKEFGIERTIHETRHTFETELDNARANRKCIDMLMGHKSSDVGNRIYNHKTIDQLREAIGLLP